MGEAGGTTAKGHLSYFKVKVAALSLKCSQAAGRNVGKFTWPAEFRVFTSSHKRSDLFMSNFAWTFLVIGLQFLFFLYVLDSSSPIPVIALENMARFYFFNVKQDDFI